MASMGFRFDAVAAGFTVFLVEDAVRGVNEQTTEEALRVLEAAGVIRIRSDRIQDSGERPAPAYDEHGNPVTHHED
jgi:hypothetical protein